MGKILEFLTVNVATADIDGALGKFRAMGLETLPPAHMPEPPAEITPPTSRRAGRKRAKASAMAATDRPRSSPKTAPAPCGWQ